MMDRLEQLWARFGTAKNRRILRLIAFPAFYLFALMLFLIWTFPFERLKDRIIAEFNARQLGGPGVRLEIDDLSSYWIRGIEAEGVRLVGPPPSAPAEGEKKPTPKVIGIDHAHVSVSLLRQLFGTSHVTFGADAFEGSLTGEATKSDEAQELRVELDAVDVGQLPMLADLVELPMAGSLSGVIDLRLPEGKLSEANGKIELYGSDVSVGDGKAKIRDSIALPKLEAGELTIEAEATDGRLKIAKFVVNGKDLELSVDGQIRLRDPFGQSLSEMGLSFKFADSYKNKNDTTRGLFGAPGSSMPGLFDLDPKIKRAKRPDGSYGWRLIGSLENLNFQPASAAGGATSRGRRAD